MISSGFDGDANQCRDGGSHGVLKQSESVAKGTLEVPSDEASQPEAFCCWCHTVVSCADIGLTLAKSTAPDRLAKP